MAFCQAGAVGSICSTTTRSRHVWTHSAAPDQEDRRTPRAGITRRPGKPRTPKAPSVPDGLVIHSQACRPARHPQRQLCAVCYNHSVLTSITASTPPGRSNRAASLKIAWLAACDTVTGHGHTTWSSVHCTRHAIPCNKTTPMLPVQRLLLCGPLASHSRPVGSLQHQGMPHLVRTNLACRRCSVGLVSCLSVGVTHPGQLMAHQAHADHVTGGVRQPRALSQPVQQLQRLLTPRGGLSTRGPTHPQH